MFSKSLFDIIKFVFIIFFTLFLLLFIYYIIPPHEAFAMSPPQETEDVIESSNLDTCNIRLWIEGYTSDSRSQKKQDIANSIITKFYGEPDFCNLPEECYRGFGGTKEDFQHLEFADFKSLNERGLLHIFVKDYTQVIPNNDILTSVKLWCEILKDDFRFIFITCQDIYESKFVWSIWQCPGDKSESYEIFMNNFALKGNSNIWLRMDKYIKNDIIIEIRDLLEVNSMYKNPRKGAISEVVKLLLNK